MTQDLSIFLVATTGGEPDRLYWFGRPAPVVNTATISTVLRQHLATPDTEAQHRISEFLSDPAALFSAPLGSDRDARTLRLQRARHHRDRN